MDLMRKQGRERAGLMCRATWLYYNSQIAHQQRHLNLKPTHDWSFFCFGLFLEWDCKTLVLELLCLYFKFFQ